MQSKKLSIGYNTALVYAFGGLIVYAIFRYFRKKKQQGTINPAEPGVSFSPTPLQGQVTYQEYFDWLRKLESVTYTAKRDGVDSQGRALFSIGMGHQIQPGEEYLLNKTITEQEVRDLFKRDIESIVKDVESAVKVPLNRNQKLAIVSIRYNTGPGGFRSGRLLNTLNSGDYAGTSVIIPTFITTSNGGIFSPGLANRRMKERDLFIKPI